jgi:hypothetical protein
VRENSAAALGKIADVRAVESLIASLFDNDVDVRQRAVQALGEIGDARAVKPLIKLFINTETNKPACTRYSLAKALKLLFENGKLNAEQKQEILAQRDKLIQKTHHDWWYKIGHHDNGEHGRSCHDDYHICDNFNEQYPGIDFPL